MSYPIKVWNGSSWEDIGLSGGALSITPPPDISTSGSVGSSSVLARSDHTHGFDANALGVLQSSAASATYLRQDTASATYAKIQSPILISPVLTSFEETVNVLSTGASAAINLDILTSTIWLYTQNASANWTVNVRGNSSTSLNSLLSNGQSISINLLSTNGATAFYQTGLQIDGSSITPKWAGGTAPTSGNTNSIDLYSINIIKTASSTYTVIESQTRAA